MINPSTTATTTTIAPHHHHHQQRSTERVTLAVVVPVVWAASSICGSGAALAGRVCGDWEGEVPGNSGAGSVSEQILTCGAAIFSTSVFELRSVEHWRTGVQNSCGWRVSCW